jgi:hypothetical protein
MAHKGKLFPYWRASELLMADIQPGGLAPVEWYYSCPGCTGPASAFITPSGRGVLPSRYAQGIPLGEWRSQIGSFLGLPIYVGHRIYYEIGGRTTKMFGALQWGSTVQGVTDPSDLTADGIMCPVIGLNGWTPTVPFPVITAGSVIAFGPQTWGGGLPLPPMVPQWDI